MGWELGQGLAGAELRRLSCHAQIPHHVDDIDVTRQDVLVKSEFQIPIFCLSSSHTLPHIGENGF
jgi:hypothetical protein